MIRRLDKSLMIVGLGLVLGAVLGFAFTFLESAGSQLWAGLGAASASAGAPRVNQPAPDFELTTLAGEQVRLSDLRGSPVVINFWATWCFPCREEMPLLQQAALDYPELVILAVNADEAPQQVQEYVTEIGLTFPILLDPGARLEKQYVVNGLPTSYFVDAEGIVRSFQIGILAPAQLDRHLAKIGVGK